MASGFGPALCLPLPLCTFQPTAIASWWMFCSPPLPSYREKAQLQQDIQQKQEMVLQRKKEITMLQAELEESSHQREQLEKQKTEAQSELDNLASEVG